MTVESANLKSSTASTTLSFAAPARTAQRLIKADAAEVLSFLSQRPAHSFLMEGFIRDRGTESELHRGTFYGYRNAANTLEGVAFIGHSIFIETQSDAALREFARIAQAFSSAHMILGESEIVERFWNYYAEQGQPARHRCRELLLEATTINPNLKAVSGLRKATVDELDLVAPVHAALAFAESGVNPLVSDPNGFRMRCRERIERRRVWVLIQDGELCFKADIVSDTPAVIYLEGVYVDSQSRRQGIGSRCLAQLSRHLLQRTKSITALVNQDSSDALRFADRVGFLRRAVYDTIFLQR